MSLHTPSMMGSPSAQPYTTPPQPPPNEPQLAVLVLDNQIEGGILRVVWGVGVVVGESMITRRPILLCQVSEDCGDTSSLVYYLGVQAP